MKPITYAIVGGPPRDWHRMAVIDLNTGEEVSRVIEVNTTEGWLVRFVAGPDGKVMRDPNGLDGPARERVTGHFEIRRR